MTFRTKLVIYKILQFIEISKKVEGDQADRKVEKHSLNQQKAKINILY